MTELIEFLWIFFSRYTANAVRIAKRLAQEKPSQIEALTNDYRLEGIW